MGSECDCCPFSDPECYFFGAYKSYKNITNNIKSKSFIEDNLYLIQTKTIPNLIKIIEESGLLKDNNIEKEKELKNKLNKYKLENNIKIICDYTDAENLVNLNDDIEKENQFIIVDETFIKIMKLDYLDNIENRKVKITNVGNEQLKVTFLSSHNEVYINDVDGNGIYKFIKKE